MSFDHHLELLDFYPRSPHSLVYSCSDYILETITLIRDTHTILSYRSDRPRKTSAMILSVSILHHVLSHATSERIETEAIGV